MAKYDRELKSRKVQGDFTGEMSEDEESRNTILGHNIEMASTSKEQSVEERIIREENMYEKLVKEIEVMRKALREIASSAGNKSVDNSIRIRVNRRHSLTR